MSNKTCFFVSPIGEEDSPERKNSDTVLKYFLKPVCEKLGYDVTRSDFDSAVEKIDQAVIEHLKNDDLVICDLTGQNPNVFYEFGYRQALGLPLIPIITKGEKIPMDIASLRTIFYVTNDLTQQESIKEKLSESINAFKADTVSPSVEKHALAPDVQSSGLGQSLLSIQDKLDEIKELVQQKNDAEIEQVATQVAKHSQPQMSDEATLVQAFLPMMTQDPDGFKKIMSMFKDYGNE